MTEKSAATQPRLTNVKDGQLADLIAHELRRIPDDPAMTTRAIDELNYVFSQARTGTFDRYRRIIQNTIRHACHPERAPLKVAALRIDAKLIPSPRVREVVEEELEDSDATAVDLQRVHEGMAQLKRMPNSDEPWKSILLPFTATSPTDGSIQFTPYGFLEAARTVVRVVLADYT